MKLTKFIDDLFPLPSKVTKMLGNGRLEAMCFDGTKRLCHIRGKLRKKVWINQSDIILIGLRDYQVGREIVGAIWDGNKSAAALHALSWRYLCTTFMLRHFYAAPLLSCHLCCATFMLRYF